MYFCIKWIALFKLIPEAAKYHSLQGKPSPDLLPTLFSIRSLYFSFDLLGFSFFFFKCIVGYNSGFLWFFWHPFRSFTISDVLAQNSNDSFAYFAMRADHSLNHRLINEVECVQSQFKWRKQGWKARGTWVKFIYTLGLEIDSSAPGALLSENIVATVWPCPKPDDTSKSLSVHVSILWVRFIVIISLPNLSGRVAAL